MPWSEKYLEEEFLCDYWYAQIRVLTFITVNFDKESIKKLASLV